MKQLKAARRAIEGPAIAVMERGIEKRRSVRPCPYCGEKFDNADKIKSHLEKSGCVARTTKKEANAAGHREQILRDKGLLDPRRPELGKVPKYSLLYKLLGGQ